MPALPRCSHSRRSSACHPRLRAQTAELRGAVVDASGATLPGVTVSIVNSATGVARTAVTDEQGVFRVPALQPGPYAIEFSLQGFGTEARKVVVTVGQVADIKVTLAVGTVAETVQVVGTLADRHRDHEVRPVGRRQPGTARGTAGPQPRLRRSGAAAAGRRSRAHQRRAFRHQHGVRWHQRPQHVFHADRRRRHGPPDLRLRHRQREPGRRPGIPRAAQSVRHGVFARWHCRGQRRHPLGHEQRAWPGLLLRPRRRAERHERVREHQAAVRFVARQRHDRRSDPSQ